MESLYAPVEATNPTEEPTQPLASPVAGDRITVEEMYRRIRARTKVTRGKFRAQLRKALKDGHVFYAANTEERPIKGPTLELTESGAKAFGEDLQPTE